MDGRTTAIGFGMFALLACGACANGSSPSLAMAPIRYAVNDHGDLEIARSEAASSDGPSLAAAPVAGNAPAAGTAAPAITLAGLPSAATLAAALAGSAAAVDAEVSTAGVASTRITTHLGAGEPSLAANLRLDAPIVGTLAPLTGLAPSLAPASLVATVGPAGIEASVTNVAAPTVEPVLSAVAPSVAAVVAPAVGPVAPVVSPMMDPLATTLTAALSPPPGPPTLAPLAGLTGALTGGGPAGLLGRGN